MVLEINMAHMRERITLALPCKATPHHVMTFRVFARYGCDDSATVSSVKSSQALPPIFLQSCETKSGMESLGSRLNRHSLPKLLSLKQGETG